MRTSLGISGDTIVALSQLVIGLTVQGYTAHQATEKAKEQMGIQSTLDQQTITGIASALYTYYHTTYPQLSLEDWIIYIQFGGDPKIDGGKPPSGETNYWTYLAIFLIVLVVTK